jgi:two-component system chemotaxis response regulator CheB
VVYVAPPAAHLVLRGGTFALTDSAPVHFSRPSVDVLFSSVAAACGPRAVGVILTGAGVDGAAGMRAIKAGGGCTIVQEPRSAQYPGMPNAASGTGCVDAALPLADIGPALGRLVATRKAGGVDG